MGDDKPGWYRKRPIAIEAMRYTGENWPKIAAWVQPGIKPDRLPPGWSLRKARGVVSLVVATLEGDHMALPGDWILRGVAGEFYPCRPDIFARTYEAVTEATPEAAG